MLPTLRTLALAAVPLAVALAVGTPASADAVADFYKGKKITLTIPSDPGGSYSIYGRFLAEHYSKYVPGKPEIITQYMPGGAGLKAANYIYNVGKKDGTELAGLFSGIPVDQRLRPGQGKYDSAKFNWIGNLLRTTTVIGVWRDSPATTVGQAEKTELRLAGSSPTSETYTVPVMLNSLVGTKFNMILGYQVIAKMGLAMERKEVHGHVGSWANWAITRKDWLDADKVAFLVQWGADNPEIPKGVPNILDLAKNDSDRQIMEFVTMTSQMGRSYVAPPGVPKDRVAALRMAFETMIKDPAFIKDAEKRNIDLRPSTGAELDQAVAKIMAIPEPLVEKAANVIGFKRK